MVKARSFHQITQVTKPPVEKALLVSVKTQKQKQSEFDESLKELSLLVETAGGKVIDILSQALSHPNVRTFIGSGKLEEIKQLVSEKDINVIVIDDDLSPSQQRNLEKELDLKILDRTKVILDIFANRAQTKDAKLQVELAQLQYILPRLTRMWEHLSRLGGGIGTRGPGETQLEVDRRRIKEKIAHLKKQLKKVSKHRLTLRKSRRSGLNISVVGYTNAGKSTLLQTLSSQPVYIADKLFATLDPLVRNVYLPELKKEIAFSDTVGFIKKLPHQLVEAFKATLEEVIEADALVHVVDCSNPQYIEQISAVYRVLEELDCVTKPIFTVFNKVDLIKDQEKINPILKRYHPAITLSAKNKEDKKKFLKAFTDFLNQNIGIA